MKRALVTGAAGFVGRHMVRELLAQGWDVHSVDVEPMTVVIDFAGPGHLHIIADTLSYFEAGVVFDLVAHAAARAPHRAAIDGQPATTIYNRLLDAAMFEWAVRTGQRRVLYLSSSAVYDPLWLPASGGHREYEVPPDGSASPPDAYGWTKLAGERTAEAAAAAGVPVHIVRPFSGYGEDQSTDFPFGAFVARAGRREDPFRIWGDGSQVRDWIHIDDVVAGALAVVEADERRPVNLCTGIGTSMVDLAQMVAAAAGYEPEYEFDLRAPAGVSYRVGDPTRMQQIYTPRVTLAEGVARALARAEV